MSHHQTKSNRKAAENHPRRARERALRNDVTGWVRKPWSWFKGLFKRSDKKPVLPATPTKANGKWDIAEIFAHAMPRRAATIASPSKHQGSKRGYKHERGSLIIHRAKIPSQHERVQAARALKQGMSLAHYRQAYCQ